MDSVQLRPVITIYEETANFWKEQRARSPFREKKFMEWVSGNIPPNSAVLDLGCGCGFPIADYFLRKRIPFTGVDGAQAMIALAKEEYPQGDWKVADMRTLNLDCEYGAIIAWDSFFHLSHSEQEEMFPSFKEHLLLGGVLVFTSGTEHGEAIGEMDGNPLFHSSFAPDEYRRLLAQSGFEVVGYYPEDPDCGRTVWTCKRV
jgi:predicted TPR repeat methyltransferase